MNHHYTESSRRKKALALLNIEVGDSVLLYLCNMIPKLKSRASKQGGSDQSTQSSGGSSSQSSGSKKKGKG
ncbi:signal recognition particle 19 kDa protein-like isoform X2 [Nilaparvata lugens]|uniref:signal recognition particle 19 kDa protein-like isoform X2 n=1 Tax=Nilaparvata lugens TaxID=108931 RepID=UPI00193D4FEB|nr:signal recognition particle 19 kDa protein-like isoform X2 [Nilaparvata lugens]